MVLAESEMMSHEEEDESPLQSEPHFKHHGFSALGRQSSIYSLTLDEFQHTLCESGKNFGSMNMDEFLTSIWTAEENQAINANQSSTSAVAVAAPSNAQAHLSITGVSVEKGSIEKQASLNRQGSLTLPAPLCRKTVDEVWSEIHKEQQGQRPDNDNSNANSHNPEATSRQPTFGEMTLEDFLIKAGVVREPCGPGVLQPPPRTYMFPSSNQNICGSYVTRAMIGLGTSGGGGGVGASATGSGGGGGITTYQPVSQGGSTIGDTSGYVGNGKRNSVYASQPPPAVCYGGRVVNGGGSGGGYAPVQPMGIAAPVSPVSSDGMCTNQRDGSNQFGLDMGGLRGRKRIIDGPVEKVVERRQRRMIKNRESAARSRARKQAYTVELEAELNQLREENAQLKQALGELERKRKQQETKNVQTKAQRAKEKLRVMRRSLSCPL